MNLELTISNDLLFNSALTILQVSKINIPQWAGLRHSILDFLKAD